ncbi:MAG: hypothetical protein M0Z66_14050 [Thermaerobacter sp.]|nr:hypothetical protein [Thermaerobacter sp.]
MVELAYLILSEKTEQAFPSSGNQPQISVVNPLMWLQPMFVPGQFTFAINAGLRYDDPDEIAQGFTVLIRDSKGNDLSHGPHIDPPANAPKENSIGMAFSLMATNVVFQEEGRYNVIVKLGDRELGSIEVPVKQAKG